MKIQKFEPLLKVKEADLLFSGMHPKNLMRLSRVEKCQSVLGIQSRRYRRA
jgi:hypothetical protein